MRSLTIAILLLATIQTSVFAASYMDKQIKNNKKSVKYNSIQTLNNNYAYLDNYLAPAEIKNFKDPNLIKLTNIKPVSQTAYDQKLAKDNITYQKIIKPVLSKKMDSINIEPTAVDFYNLYRITEKIIRANNLDYCNWRIAIRKAPDEVNASSTAANFIVINTALYDSLHNNEDALAFVVAHEMAHLILGHSQRTAELYRKLKILGANGNTDSPLGDIIVTTVSLSSKQSIYKELREMEFMADSEAVTLALHAGYSPSKLIEALNFLETLPQLKSAYNTHPLIKKRIENVSENIYFANPEWIEEGKYNIYNSNVLTSKKSSDRVSIIINKSENSDKIYEIEPIDKKLERIAYVSYKKGDWKNAIKYFSKLVDMNENYIPYLYMSYASEQLYSETKDPKYLKAATKYVEKASILNPKDKNITKQIQDLEQDML